METAIWLIALHSETFISWKLDEIIRKKLLVVKKKQTRILQKLDLKEIAVM